MNNYCKTHREAAEYLGVTVWVLRYAIRKGKAPKLTRNRDGFLCYMHADLRRWQKERTGAGKLTTKEAAAHLGTSVGYLTRLRHDGRGPEYRGKGRNVRYTLVDLNAWNASRKRYAATKAQKLNERADAMIAAAQRLKLLAERTTNVSTEAFE